jgi:antitoxin Phd
MMRTMAAKAAKDGFGDLLDSAQREPVTIARNGRPVAIVLSVGEFERLKALEDAWWAAKADAAAKEGFLGRGKSDRLLREILNAKP